MVTVVGVFLILFLVVISPFVCARLVARNLREELEKEWKWQTKLIGQAEEVAKKATATAVLVLDRQESLDKKTDEAYRRIDAYLQKLEMLVNSDMMAARRDELIRTKELKVALDRIVTLTTLSRQQPDSMYIEAIESTTRRIEELENILGVRTYEKVG